MKMRHVLRFCAAVILLACVTTAHAGGFLQGSGGAITGDDISGFNPGAIPYANNSGTLTEDTVTLSFDALAGALVADKLKSGNNTLVGTVANKLNPAHLALTGQAVGDLLYADSTASFTRLAKGTAHQIVGMNAGATAPEYKSVTGSGSVVLATSPTLSSPSIAKVGNLTGNGFVKTSAGDGTLSIDTNTYLTGNQTITLGTDLSGSGTTTLNATIVNDAVTYAKLQNVSAASKLLGRGDSGAGDPQELTLGSGLSMSGTTIAATGANTVLGNLASVAINESLLPATTSAIDLGDATHTWEDLFLDGTTLIGTTTATDPTFSAPSKLRVVDQSVSFNFLNVADAIGFFTLHKGATTGYLGIAAGSFTLGTISDTTFAVQTNNEDRWYFLGDASAGAFVPVVDNVTDIGLAGTNRVRSIYVGTKLNVAGSDGVTLTCSAMPTQVTIKGGAITSVTGGTCS